MRLKITTYILFFERPLPLLRFISSNAVDIALLVYWGDFDNVTSKEILSSRVDESLKAAFIWSSASVSWSLRSLAALQVINVLLYHISSQAVLLQLLIIECKCFGYFNFRPAGKVVLLFFDSFAHFMKNARQESTEERLLRSFITMTILQSPWNVTLEIIDSTANPFQIRL